MTIINLIDAITENFMEAMPGQPWAPKYSADNQVTTYCNLFVNGVAKSLGYFSFWPSNLSNPLTANEIYAWVWSSSEWTQITGDVAQAHANSGAFVIAVQDGDPHGHVDVIMPGTMVNSTKWGKQVPKCCNVGAQIFIGKGVNWAFGDKEPNYFVLNSTVPKEVS